MPLQVGGAERLWWGFVDHLNASSPYTADLVKLPTPERSFGEVLDAYERFSTLDVSGYDIVVVGKYPAWMVEHPDLRVYLLHPLRGLYDQYPAEAPTEVPAGEPAVRALLALLEAHPADRGVLPEAFGRLHEIRAELEGSPLLGLPSPLLRAVVRWMDGVAFGPGRVRQFVALSETVRRREGYLPAGADVRVAYPDTPLAVRPGRDRRHVLCVSRLDVPKRIDLVIAAYAASGVRLPLVIAGAGPDEARLRELARDVPGVELRGRVGDPELIELYADAAVVAFTPWDEDFGFITLEALRAGAPVVTTTDSGGPAELIRDGETGRVVAPDPVELGAAIRALVDDKRAAKRMGAAGQRLAAHIGFPQLVDALLAP